MIIDKVKAIMQSKEKLFRQWLYDLGAPLNSDLPSEVLNLPFFKLFSSALKLESGLDKNGLLYEKLKSNYGGLTKEDIYHE